MKPDRQKEDRDDDEKSSLIFDHMKDKHKKRVIYKETNFMFEVVESFRDSLTKHITETVRVREGRVCKMFYNNKGEGKLIFNLNRKSQVFAPRKRFVKEAN